MRTDEEILEQTNELALLFGEMHGFKWQPKREYKYLYYSPDERAQAFWEMARTAQLKLTQTDPNDFI